MAIYNGQLFVTADETLDLFNVWTLTLNPARSVTEIKGASVSQESREQAGAGYDSVEQGSPFAYGGRVGYFFGGRVNYKTGGRVSFKNGGLASIL